MVRNFPRTTRRRVIAALAASSVLLGIAAIPLASADDLDERKQRVQGDINDTLEHLDQSSAELQAPTRRCVPPRPSSPPRSSTSPRRGASWPPPRCSTGRCRPSSRPPSARLEAARADLAEGREKIAEQEETLGQIAVQNYQSGDPSLLGCPWCSPPRTPPS